MDNRILSVAITSGNIETRYREIYIKASGVSFGNSTPSTCEVVMLNLSSSSRNKILKLTNPIKDSNSVILVDVYAGRESYGEQKIFSGTAYRTSLIPRPDVGVRIKCLPRLAINNKSTIKNRSAKEGVKLSTISKWVADDAGLDLNFSATDKIISSYSHSGTAQKQVEDLENLTESRVFIDGNTLNVVDDNHQEKIAPIKCSASRGMISAERTEIGVNITMLYTPSIKVGSVLDVESSLDVSSSGIYMVYKCGFDLSNRDDSFFTVVECRRVRS